MNGFSQYEEKKRAILAFLHVYSQCSKRYLDPVTHIEFFSNLDLNISCKKIEYWNPEEWDIFAAELGSALDNIRTSSKAKGSLLKVDVKGIVKRIYSHIVHCHANSARYVLWGDSLYPDSLYHIADAPLGLTLLGNSDLLYRACVSVVGARKPNFMSLEQCYLLGSRLGEMDWVCVSGGAYGCDIQTHQGVLAASAIECPAIVVFAGGLSHLYPQGNKAVFSEMIEAGALFLSERLWGQEARFYDFPVRNRIISGLSSELIVMQAALKSGTFVTANKALDQGREVLVLRQHPDDPNCSGSQKLVEEGAYSFSDADDLFINYRFAHEIRGLL